MTNLESQPKPISFENLPPRFWAFERDARGVVLTARSLGGWVLHVESDERFRWQEIRDSISLLARIEYDEFGNKTEVRDGEGVVSKTQFDDLHRAVEVVRFGSEVTRCQYDGLGHMTERTGPGDQRETWMYDRFGHLVAYTNALGHTTRMEYDTEGMLTAIINRVGERLEYRRDAEGRTIEEKLFDGRIQRYEYDPRGRRIKIELSDGRTVAQRFDAAGRLVCREASDGLIEEFAYDKEGRVIKARNNHAVVELKRDPVGRILKEVQNGRPVHYRYDREGKRTGRSLPFKRTGSKLKRLFDLRGRLIALEDERGPCQELRWDTLDRLVERRCPGGVKELRTYDSARRLYEQRIESATGGTGRTHSYDDRGNLAVLQEKGHGSVQFAYDQLNRLTEVRKGGKVVESYAYDANDAVCATHRGRRTLGPGGRTLDDGSRRWSYGKDGSVAGFQVGHSARSLKHDVNGRLVEVAEPDGTVIRYEYDPFGRRIAKMVGDDRTEFLWEGWTLAAELRGGEVQAIYFSPGLRPLAQWNCGERRTPVLDQRGAVREVYDDQGRRRWSCALEAYGNLVSQAGDVPNPFRLRGQYQDDETGLYYQFSRHYDADLGDYTAPDPIGIQGGPNFYAYPRNPLRWDDPFGLQCPDGKDPKFHKDDVDPNAVKTQTPPEDFEEEPPTKPGNQLPDPTGPNKPPLDGGKYAGQGVEMTPYGQQWDKDNNVHIFTPEELESLRVVPDKNGNLVYNQTGEPIPQGKDPPPIYVMDENGNVYVTTPVEGAVHHSSLAGGNKPVAAGEIQTGPDGSPILNDSSGHYGPNLPKGAPQTAAKQLESQGSKPAAGVDTFK